MTENVAELPKAYEISYVNCKTLNHSSILQQWKITIFFTSMEKQSDKFSVVVIVHSLSWVWHFVTPWTAAHQVSLSFTFSHSCPLSRRCHPTISSSVTLFSSCPQSFPASRSLPVSQLCIRWSKYWSFSFSIRFLPMTIQCWFPLGWTDLISLLSKGLSRVFLLIYGKTNTIL